MTTPTATLPAIARAYGLGLSLRQLSTLTGVSYGTVRTRLVRCGVELRSRAAAPRQPLPIERLDPAVVAELAGEVTSDE